MHLGDPGPDAFAQDRLDLDSLLRMAYNESMKLAKPLSILLISSLVMQVMAIYTSGKVKLHNAKLVSHKKDVLGKAWFKYIDDYPELLLKKDKDYKIDQYCSFEIQADEKGGVDLDSIKLAKHENNFGYNLKAIQFLRETPIKVKQKNSEKPIKLEFVYHSF